MASPDQLWTINEIAAALSSSERRTVFYLCESLETDHSEACMKEMLSLKVMHLENAHLFLAELVWRLGRFDILRSVFKISRGDLERESRQILPQFRVLMTKISEDLDTEDLKSIKFLLSHTLSREKIENAKNFLDMIVELEKLDSFSPERVNLVEECLRNIGRVDLAKKLAAHRISGGKPERCPNSSQQESCRGSRIRQESPPVVVNRPLATFREQSPESVPCIYKFDSNPRGVCVIIDCVGKDGEMLEQTFKALDFTVVLHKYLSADDTLSALREILSQMENLRSDGFVCCIISRGSTSHLLGTDSYGGLALDRVRRLVTADECPVLAGKPKLFFIQRYNIQEYLPYPVMQHRDEDLEPDGRDRVLTCIPRDADVFWSHCWTDERQLEKEQHRSVYLKALTDALHKAQKRKTKIIDIQMEVNKEIFEYSGRCDRKRHEATYHIDVKHTLRKDLYF